MSQWKQAEKIASYYGQFFKTATTSLVWLGLMAVYPLRRKESKPTSREPVFLFDSELLRQTQRNLTKGPEEAIMIMSGIRKGNVAVPIEAREGQYDYATPTKAKLTGLSTLRALGDPVAIGRTPLALVHSHPGAGASAVTPSQIDMETQALYEACGYNTISAIFSRGKPFFVRFFAESLQFRVLVSGNNIQEVEHNVFEIA